ncbi:Uncharacterised protein [uncultured archaeon]|nr:Uncharacterised protein [uncultured archaeon]
MRLPCLSTTLTIASLISRPVAASFTVTVTSFSTPDRNVSGETCASISLGDATAIVRLFWKTIASSETRVIIIVPLPALWGVNAALNLIEDLGPRLPNGSRGNSKSFRIPPVSCVSASVIL